MVGFVPGPRHEPTDVCHDLVLLADAQQDPSPSCRIGAVDGGEEALRHPFRRLLRHEVAVFQAQRLGVGRRRRPGQGQRIEGSGCRPMLTCWFHAGKVLGGRSGMDAVVVAAVPGAGLAGAATRCDVGAREAAAHCREASTNR